MVYLLASPSKSLGTEDSLKYMVTWQHTNTIFVIKHYLGHHTVNTSAEDIKLAHQRQAQNQDGSQHPYHEHHGDGQWLHIKESYFPNQ